MAFPASASVVPPASAPSSERPSSASHPRASIVFLIVVAALAVMADLATKWWAKTHLSGYDGLKHSMKKVEVWKGHVDFIFAQNPGGAWSFLRSVPDDLRRPFFLVVSAAAIVFIVNVYRRIRKDQRAMVWGLPLALGGALGNLADRIRFGWVVDFVDCYVMKNGAEHHWPTFNVADIAIVIGVGLMAIDMLVSKRPKAIAQPAPTSLPPLPPAAS